MKKLTQAELEATLGITHHDLVLYEKGCKVPDEKTILKLAKFFDVTVNSLKRGDLSDRESVFALVLGEIIKDVRKAQGYTQVELAKKIGVSDSTISEWENGINEPNASNIYHLSRVLNISSDHLLGLNSFTNELFTVPVCNEISSDEQNLINDYRNLNSSGKTYVKYTIKTLLTPTVANSNTNNTA